MKPDKTRKRNQAGIALITTLLLLLLMAAMVVGFMLLVTEGQRLSGMDSDQLRAFYGAESGMEKLTADLGTLFAATYSPSSAQVNALTATPPSLPSTTGVSYVDAQGNSTYSIGFQTDSKGNPQAQFAQITSGSSAFQGMSALETTYTLTVGALTNTGGQVKLQRTTQTVGIPLFQFGIFSDTDLSFFPGPPFDFGGRTHTNGNLFLDSGATLFMRSPVTASKDILRDCLSNTHPEPGPHGGTVQITKGGGVLQPLNFGQGSLRSCLGSAKNGSWPAVSGSFNGNLRSGVKPLNLSIVLLGNGNSTPIDMIRRPIAGELTSNPGVLGERYFSQASLRVLLSDNAADITSLPCVSSSPPFNLADLALPPGTWTGNAAALRAAMTGAGTTPLPLAASGAAGGAYAPGTGIGGVAAPGGDGYWQANGTKILTGYIKIDAQTSYGAPCGTYRDVTQEILSLGYAGKNINPVPQSLDGASLNPAWAGTVNNMEYGASPALPSLPGSQMSGQGAAALAAGTFAANSTLAAPTGTCLDPHPNAVIRLERIRDNPSSVPFASGKLGVPASNKPLRSTVAQVCGVDPSTGTIVAGWTPQPSDFWPNALFDTREGYNRQATPVAPFNNRVTLGGIMNYVELDVNNLARWFSGTIGASGPSTQDPAVAPNNFVVYISDRRGNYLPAGTAVGSWPPLSPSGHETGEYGYFDYVNRADIKGCPDNALEPAAATGGVSAEDPGASGVLNTYGEVTFPPGLVDSTGVTTASTIWTIAPVVPDPLCPTGSGGINPWPRSFLLNANEGRENPNALFRRAVKVVNGNRINLPVCPGGVSCGLSITTENPLYDQGDFNANSAGGGFVDPSVATSLAGDAITVLSNNWNDVNSFAFPFNNPSARTGATTYVRAGVLGGKEVSFTIPGWDTTAVDASQDFGTDGGVHNFIRFLERWNGTLFYEGSIISMFYNRQAVGLFNTGGNNYSPPSRGYQFDVNFLNPTLLPPRTPMFRDVNTTGFTQLLLPNQ